MDWLGHRFSLNDLTETVDCLFLGRKHVFLNCSRGESQLLQIDSIRKDAILFGK